MRKWSYFIIFFICGALTLAAADYLEIAEPLEAVGQPAMDLANRLSKLREYFLWAENEDPEETLPEEQEVISVEEETESPVPEEIPEEPVPEEAAGEEEPVTYRDPSEVEYMTVDEDYFSDAIFIGDSRTVGLLRYGEWEEPVSFHASTGLTVFGLFTKPVEGTDGVKRTLEEVLSQNQYQKIYLMVGINEMGRGNLEEFLEEYRSAIEHIRELQPEAILYLQGIMKVTQKRSDKGDYIHNQGIEERNVGIAGLADYVNVYYLDVNQALCTPEGVLEPSYTSDGVHLKAQYVPLWKEFLKEHAVVLD